jgi:hypothetical protein
MRNNIASKRKQQSYPKRRHYIFNLKDACTQKKGQGGRRLLKVYL